MPLKLIEKSAIIFIFFLFGCGQEDETVEKPVENEKAYPHELLDGFDEGIIAFWNVENLFDTIKSSSKDDKAFTPEGRYEWDTKKYNYKLSQLTSVFNKLTKKPPLMFGLAEVENRNVILDLINSTGYETPYRISHFATGDPRGISVALCFDTGRFHKITDRAIPIIYKNQTKSQTREILYVKGLLKDSIPLHVYVNHWKSRSGGVENTKNKRIQAAQVLRTHIDSIQKADDDPRIVVMGDFNDEPNNESVYNVLSAKKPGSSKGDNKTLYNLSYDKGKNEVSGTYVYKDEWKMYDQIIVSSNLLYNEGELYVSEFAKIFSDPSFLEPNYHNVYAPSPTFNGGTYIGGPSDHHLTYIRLYSTN